jgi:hypothetical protein
MDRIDLFQDRYQCRAHATTVMNLRAQRNTEKFLVFAHFSASQEGFSPVKVDLVSINGAVSICPENSAC